MPSLPIDMISCVPYSSDLHDRLDRTKQKKEKLEMEMEIYRTELQTYLQMVRPRTRHTKFSEHY